MEVQKLIEKVVESLLECNGVVRNTSNRVLRVHSARELSFKTGKLVLLFGSRL